MPPTLQNLQPQPLSLLLNPRAFSGSGSRVSASVGAANNALSLGEVIAIPIAIVVAILIGILVYACLKAEASESSSDRGGVMEETAREYNNRDSLYDSEWDRHALVTGGDGDKGGERGHNRESSSSSSSRGRRAEEEEEEEARKWLVQPLSPLPPVAMRH